MRKTRKYIYRKPKRRLAWRHLENNLLNYKGIIKNCSLKWAYSRNNRASISQVPVHRKKIIGKTNNWIQLEKLENFERRCLNPHLEHEQFSTFAKLRNFCADTVPLRRENRLITPTCFCTLHYYLASSMLAYSYFRRRDFSSSSLKISLKLVTISESGTKQRAFKNIFSVQIAARELLHIVIVVNSRRKCKIQFGERSERSELLLRTRSKQLKFSV